MPAGPQLRGTWTGGAVPQFPTGVDFTGLSAAMKEVYGDYITSQLPQEVTLYRLFSEALGVEIQDGRVFVESIHDGRNRSGGPRPESGIRLPNRQSQGFDRFEIPVRYYHATGGFSAATLLATARNEAALLNVMDAEVNGAMNDIKKDLNIDLYGYPSGILSVVRSVGAVAGGDTTINLYPAAQADEFGAGPAGLQTFLALQGSRFFSPGMEVLVGALTAATGVITGRQSAGTNYTAAYAAAAGFTTVVSKPLFNTVILDGDQSAGADGIVDGDVIVRAGSVASGAAAHHHINGLEYLVDDTSQVYDYLDDLQGQPRDTRTELRSIVIDQAGAVVTEEDVHNLVHGIVEESGEEPDLLLTTRVGREVIFNFYRDQGRFAPTQFAGGYSAEALTVQVGGQALPVYVDKDCPYRTIYALNTSRMKRYVQADFHLAEEGGSVLERSATGDDTWDFHIRWHGNMGVTAGNAHGKLTDADGTIGGVAQGSLPQQYGRGTAAVSV